MPCTPKIRQCCIRFTSFRLGWYLRDSPTLNSSWLMHRHSGVHLRRLLHGQRMRSRAGFRTEPAQHSTHAAGRHILFHDRRLRIGLAASLLLQMMHPCSISLDLLLQTYRSIRRFLKYLSGNWRPDTDLLSHDNRYKEKPTRPGVPHLGQHV